MSYDGIGVSDTMLDSLSLQLREAELRRAEAERAHQVIIIIIFITIFLYHNKMCIKRLTSCLMHNNNNRSTIKWVFGSHLVGCNNIWP